MHKNTDLAEDLYAAFNERDFDRSIAKAAPGVKWVNVSTGQEFDGKDGMREYMSGWASAFPDAKVAIKKITADEETIVTEFHGQGTHNGVLHTPGGDIPPTGRTIDVPFCEVMKLKDGQIVEGRLYFDTATMLRQLGVRE